MSNMVINTNVLALNSHRALKGVGGTQAKASERLSSGLRINRAADDAAGLAISEKMRSQIRGLDQASRNSQDGISLIQTAEGALQETENMLQRMRELTVQASNDTLEPEDRDKIALELNQLSDEIDKTAEKTEFNKKKLIDGSWSSQSLYFQTGANAGQGLTINIGAMDAKTLGVTKASIGGVVGNAGAGAAAGTTITAGNAIFTAAGAAASTIDFALSTTASVNAGNYIISDKSRFEISEDGKVTLFGFDGHENGSVIDMKTLKSGFTLEADNGSTLAFAPSALGNGSPGELTYTASATAGNAITADPGSVGATQVLSTSGDNVLVITGGSKSDGTYDKANSTYKFSGSSTVYALDISGKAITLQKGKEYTTAELKDLYGGAAPTTMQFTVDGKQYEITFGTSLVSAGASAVVKGSASGSGASISKLTDTIDAAIEKVSAQRANLGAYQNRLEHTIKNLDVASENLSASESRIRDTDMAKEMMTMTKSSVLSQAAMSMLAQANQGPQNLLQLLR